MNETTSTEYLSKRRELIEKLDQAIALGTEARSIWDAAIEKVEEKMFKKAA